MPSWEPQPAPKCPLCLQNTLNCPLSLLKYNKVPSWELKPPLKCPSFAPALQKVCARHCINMICWYGGSASDAEQVKTETSYWSTGNAAVRAALIQWVSEQQSVFWRRFWPGCQSVSGTKCWRVVSATNELLLINNGDFGCCGSCQLNAWHVLGNWAHTLSLLCHWFGWWKHSHSHRVTIRRLWSSDRNRDFLVRHSERRLRLDQEKEAGGDLLMTSGSCVTWPHTHTHKHTHTHSCTHLQWNRRKCGSNWQSHGAGWCQSALVKLSDVATNIKTRVRKHFRRVVRYHSSGLKRVRDLTALLQRSTTSRLKEKETHRQRSQQSVNSVLIRVVVVQSLGWQLKRLQEKRVRTSRVYKKPYKEPFTH